jgi:hypothetical protein
MMPGSGRDWLLVTLVAAVATLILTWGHLFLFSSNADPRMVLQPWLLYQGFIQYVDIADEHAPLLPQILAWLLPLFGEDALLTARVVHAVLVAATTLLTTLWVGRKAGVAAALATALFFLSWSMRFGFWGMWHNLALSPLYVLLFIILVEWPNDRKLFLKVAILGILTGVGILLKQQAVLLLFIGLAWLGYLLHIRQLLFLRFLSAFTGYLVSIAAPILLYLLYYLSRGGAIADIFYWVLWFNVTSGYSRLGWLPPTAGAINQILPAFLLLVPFVFTLRSHSLPGIPPLTRGFLLAFLAAALIYLYPRYSLPHWVVAFPFIAAASGIVCAEILSSLRRHEGKRQLQHALYWGLILFWALYAWTIYASAWSGPPRTMLKYSHLTVLATELESRIPPDSTMVLLPDNEALGNLYYLMRKQPPRFWVMNYPWFMNERVINRWLEVIEMEKPQILIHTEDMAALWDEAPELVDYMVSYYETIDSIVWEDRAVHIMTRR